MTSLPTPEVLTPPTTPPRRRIRNPDMHRAAILDAALAAFAERGYARATMRDIAQRAGVTHGLVQRHFGSKEALFLAAVPASRHWDNMIGGDPADLPERIAKMFVARMEEAAGLDPLMALIRSAASDVDAAKRLYAALQARGAEIYEDFLGSPGGALHLDAAYALLIGVTFNRYVIGMGPLAEMDRDALTTYLTTCIRQIIELPAPTTAQPE
ncbi:helix-turn-helix transcriptional regulator [Pigmentiphaga aceris]|uniref:Helix-turn-helix transcriptional regulator n=1 Tax=Pigmentiphaga aceris TaxID=1940612 RepID=A0A5C0AW32_9BURK|nr:TetR/AcrR family transcriptional regulator [Pigmentiphaga aceris]QEI05946.1 helix-turn-helix transcriptional regulator [Pigmentiphaga aceris]